MSSLLVPLNIKLLQKDKLVEIQFSNGENFLLTCEFLRVFSPSADNKHGKLFGKKLAQRKKNVNIINIEAVGHYAVRLIFDDGHNTGLYTWEFLYELAKNQTVYWAKYLLDLKKVDPDQN